MLSDPEIADELGSPRWQSLSAYRARSSTSSSGFNKRSRVNITFVLTAKLRNTPAVLPEHTFQQHLNHRIPSSLHGREHQYGAAPHQTSNARISSIPAFASTQWASAGPRYSGTGGGGGKSASTSLETEKFLTAFSLSLRSCTSSCTITCARGTSFGRMIERACRLVEFCWENVQVGRHPLGDR